MKEKYNAGKIKSNPRNELLSTFFGKHFNTINRWRTNKIKSILFIEKYLNDDDLKNVKDDGSLVKFENIQIENTFYKNIIKKMSIKICSVQSSNNDAIKLFDACLLEFVLTENFEIKKKKSIFTHFSKMPKKIILKENFIKFIINKKDYAVLILMMLTYVTDEEFEFLIDYSLNKVNI